MFSVKLCCKIVFPLGKCASDDIISIGILKKTTTNCDKLWSSLLDTVGKDNSQFVPWCCSDYGEGLESASVQETDRKLTRSSAMKGQMPRNHPEF